MNKKVVIDAGHGGHDGGAVGAKSNEKDHALAISLLVERHLSSVGVHTKMTRSTDVFVTLNNRSKISNEFKADAFVSIHMNSASNRSASGTEVLFMQNKDKTLADDVYPLLVRATGLKPRGVKYQNVSVVRKTNAPAILCEIGFVSNSSDEAKLSNIYFRNDVAEAIAEGVLKFLKVEKELTYELLGSDGHFMDALIVRNNGLYVNARRWESWFSVSVGWDENIRKVLLSDKPVTTILIDGAGYVSIDEAAKITGLKMDVDDDKRIITLSRPEVK